MRGSQKDVIRPLCLSLFHTLSYIRSYRQAQAAVLAVLPRLHQLKVPTKRPTDYFAEMAKSDQQMQKVRNGKGFLWKTEALYLSHEVLILWPRGAKSQLTGKDPDAGKD